MSDSRSGVTPQARGERRRTRTRNSVLDAAEQLLSNRTVEDVRIDDVAAAAGVSPASVYVHFGSKDALVSAVVQRLIDVSMAQILSAATGEGTPFEQVEQVGLIYLNLLSEHPTLTRYLVVPDIGEVGGGLDGQVVDSVELLRVTIEERIDAAVALGEIRPVDSRMLSYFLFGAWNGVAALALRSDRVGLSPEQVRQCLMQARDLVSVALRTLG